MPEFRTGDTVEVHVKIVEEGKSRIQVFEGIVMVRNGSGISETFTVRKISFGEGVERVFPIHSPSIAKIVVVKRGKVKRSRLYYLRDKIGKGTKIEEKMAKKETPEAAPAEVREAGKEEGA
ncbi:MAG: 50S ribosomal protein L19 [Candidatus Omnitrophota bacterium]